MAAPHSVIETVAFRIAGDEANRRVAVVEVTGFGLFAGEQPVTGGCYDARMGTTDHHYGCVTCGQQRREDPGHFGALRSRVALASPLFIAEIRRWLRVTCFRCGAAVIDDKALARIRGLSAPQRLVKAALAVKDGDRCPRCGDPHPKIVKDEEDYFTFHAEYPAAKGAGAAAGEGAAAAGAAGEGAAAGAAGAAAAAGRRRRLYPDAIRAIFERVSAETTRALGAATYHPRDLVLRDLVVPPTTIRPGVRMGFGAGGAKSFHDLTNMWQYIVKRNLMLDEEPPAQVTREADRLIQNAQQLYFDMILGSAATSATNGNTGRRGIVSGGVAPSSVVRGLGKKAGRFRKNLLGKRTWWMSRSTISGNPFLLIDEVGYPVAFARTLQVEEKVQEFNRARLNVYFLNGERKYPGCTRVVKASTGAVHRVGGLSRDFQLEVGDTILRDVVTGDAAFFNRAPSLERSSIGVHRVVVFEDPSIHTFQMNVAACDWYNADFDGDQMNLWVPHTVMARAEAVPMSGVENWFISTKSSGPVAGQVQDSNVGCFELTRSAALMDKPHAMRLFATARVAPPDFSDGGAGARFTGREVVSRLLERTPVNYDRRPRWYSEALVPYLDYDPQETRTVIRRGRLLRGVLDKDSVGAGAGGGVFHLIAREHGARKALKAIYALQQMAIGFVANRGFTVGIGDMVVGPAGLAEIQDIVAGVLRESALVSARLTRGELVPPIGMTTHGFYERLQQEALKIPDELLRPILGAVRPDHNGLFKMIATGSKGSMPNLFHIMGLIGSVEINTQRIRELFGFRRTCVYFPRFAVSAEAYGFIRNCYVTGMTSSEFVFAAMNGRFDLITKALSTASTGYMSRKMVMAAQSDIVDNFRRLAKDGRVVQLVAGGDALDTRRVEWVRFRTVLLADDALAAGFRLDLAGVAGPPAALAAARAAGAAAFAAVRADRDAFRAAARRLEDSDFEAPLRDSRQMPVDVARLVRDVKIAREGGGGGGAAAGPAPGPPGGAPDAAALAEMLGRVEALCAALPYVLVNEVQERRRAPVPAHLRAAAGLLQMLVRAELAGPELRGLAPAELDFVLAAVRLQYAQALIDYGTAAGVIAAQAVSEPLTQYMLDSHHRSVAGGTNKAGIIRPAEIFGAKAVEAEQSAEMLLRVLPEFEGDRAEVLQIANQIELMVLDQFVSVWDLLLEPLDALIYPPFLTDAAWVAEFARNHPLLPPPDDLTNWCVRLRLDEAAMVLKGVGLGLLVERVRAEHPGVYVVHSAENAPAAVVRVYFRAAQFRRGPQDEGRVREAALKELLPTVLRGVPGVIAARVVEVSRHSAGADGALASARVFAIRTTGTNIYGVLAVRRVDPLRIVSSSIGDTAKVFGLAAARAAIVREVRRFMGSKAPNARHLGVFADEMTMTGRVTSLERGGIDVRERDNVLLRMSMAAPTQVLQKAAVAGTAGRVYGAAPALALGRPPTLGTTWNEFSMDEDFVRENVQSVDSVFDDL